MGDDKPLISYADFAKLDLRVGTVVAVEEVEKSDKLLKLTVDLGNPPAGGGKRTILSGISKYFDIERLIGVEVLVLANLEPKKIMGLESQGMVLTGVEKIKNIKNIKNEGAEEKITLLIPQSKVPEGTGVE